MASPDGGLCKNATLAKLRVASAWRILDESVRYTRAKVLYPRVLRIRNWQRRGAVGAGEPRFVYSALFLLEFGDFSESAMNGWSSHIASALAGCLLLVSLGCGSGGPDSPIATRRDEGKLKLLGVEYGRFVALNENLPPRDQDEFLQYLRSRESRLAGYGLESIDGLLVSPREGQKMIVVQGGKEGIMSPDGFPWAAYEETGVRGTRLVVSGRGAIVEMDRDEFERTFPNE